MKKSQLRSTLLAASALSVSIATHLHAATFTSAASGAWSVPTSWTAGVLFPDTWNTDSAVIAAAHTISYDGLGTSFPFGNLIVANGNAITIDGGTLNQTWAPGAPPAFGTAIAFGVNGAVNGNGTLSINLGGTFDSGTANAVAVGITSTALGAGTGNGTVHVNDGTFFLGAASSAAGGRGLAIGIDTGAVGVFNLGNGAGAAALLDAATNNALVTIGGRLAEATGGTGTMTIKADGQLNQGSRAINVGDDLGTGTLAVDGGLIQGGAGALRIGTDGGNGTLTMSAGFIDRAGDHDLFLGNGAGSTGVFTQSGGTLDLHGGHMQVGEGGNGTYNISAGTVSNAAWFHVGSGGGSVGTMNVALSNPAGVVSGNQLYVGNNSATGTVTVTSGTLRIDDFGEVGRGSGTGTLNVTGPTARVVVAAAGGDPFFNVGVINGHGTVNITGGGQLHTTNTWFTLGNGNGTTGEATVSGTGSKLTSKGLIVGWNGLATGTLNISDNAVVENSGRELSVGRDHNNTTGIINIDSGGTLNNTGTDAFVGHNGIGTMNMTGGAFNNTNPTVFGAGPGSVGTLNLTGPGTVTAANFHLGRNGGVGHVVQSAGSVVSNSWSNIGDDPGPGTSDYKISGGSYTVASGGMELGRTRGGSMDISGTGTVSIAGELAIVGSHAGGVGSLTLSGGGTLNVTANAGLVLGYDQNSDGAFTQTGGTLNMNGKHFQIGGEGGTATGTYNITAGAVNNVGWFHVGSQAGSVGTMNVSFSNPADVISGGQLYLGNNSATGSVTVTSGTLRIDDVAEVGRFGGTGTLNVIGLNARVIGGGSGGDPFFKVGRESGHGIVNITGGGKLHTTNTWFTLGETNGSVGEATVSGVGSKLDSNGLIVGWNGAATGTLNITSRGVVTNVGRELSVGRDNAVTSGFININSGGTLNTIEPRIGHNGIGTVSMNNGTFNATGGSTILGSDGGSASGTVAMSAGSAFNVNGGRVYIGRYGTGSLTLATGSTFTHTSADQFNIGGVEEENGSNFASVGTMTVDATSSVSTTNFIRVGHGNAGVNPARGTVNLNGGTINAGNWMGLGHEGGDGILNMSGGTITNSAEFYVGIDDNGHTRTSTGVANLTGVTPGSITAGTTIWIGRNGGNGTVNMSGAAATSLISANVITLGEGGVGSGGAQTQGTLNIGNPNAVVRSANAIYVGLNGGIGVVNQTAGSLIETNQWLTLAGGAGSTGTYNLSGGTVTSNFIEVGADGAGTFNVSGTGAVTASQFTVGTRATGTGTVNVSTGGLVTNSGTIFLGGDQGPGSGTLNILGGTVQTNNVIASFGAASLTLDGGTLRANANEADFLRGFTNSGGHSAINLLGAGGTFDTNGFNARITGANVIAGTDAAMNGLAGTVLSKTGLGTLTLETAVGTGFLSVHALQGTLDFETSQTLDALVIEQGATVTLSALFTPPAPAVADGAALLAGSTAQGVPEPGSIGLLILGACGLLGARRRR